MANLLQLNEFTYTYILSASLLKKKKERKKKLHYQQRTEQFLPLNDSSLLQILAVERSIVPDIQTRCY